MSSASVSVRVAAIQMMWSIDLAFACRLLGKPVEHVIAVLCTPAPLAPVFGAKNRAALASGCHDKAGIEPAKIVRVHAHHALIEAQQVEIDELMQRAAMQQPQHLGKR